MDKILYEVKISSRIFIKPFVLCIVAFFAGLFIVTFRRLSENGENGFLIYSILIFIAISFMMGKFVQGIKGLATYINTKIFITQDEIVKKNSSAMVAIKFQDIREIAIDGSDIIIYNDNIPLLIPCVCNVEDVKKMILELAPHAKTL